MHRLPRISPDVPIQYKEYTIPAGVRYPSNIAISAANPIIDTRRHVWVLDAQRSCDLPFSG